jgi:eukaryotic-like serine/threonine-protein kinase
MAVVTGQAFGNFQVVRLLGEGGFGEVYEAENPFLQRRAAVKVLHAGMGQDPELVRRFLNEARAASAIRHPNIIDVFDAGVTADGEPYILMEFLEGDSLQKLIFQQGKMNLATVQEVARQAGSALSAAHMAGIVHRDLKPENLFLIPNASAPLGFSVKVLDFGIAKVKRADMGSTLKTQAGLLMGSPAYMSPEQCRDSSDVDHRTDIYSLGIIVYEMLAGVPPFSSKSATEMLVLQMTADPPPLRQYVPDLPEHVEQAVVRALLKDREVRFNSVDYFVGALAGTYPAATAQGNAPSGALDLAQMVGRSTMAGIGGGKTPPHLAAPPLSSRVGLTPAPVPGSATITTFSHATGETGADEFPLDDEGPPRRRLESRRWPIVAVIGVAVAAAAFLFLRRGPEPVSMPAPVAQPVAAVAAPVVPATIRVSVRTDPPGATVVDSKQGSPVGVTPFERTFPQGNETLSLSVHLDGYKDETIAVTLDANSSTSLDLERLQPRPADAAKPQTPAVKKRPQATQLKQPKQSTKIDKEDEWRVH